MSANRLGIATLVLLVLVGTTVALRTSREREDNQPPKVVITLPKIDKDKIDELELSAADHPKIHLVKKGDDWRMVEPVDAKADEDAVKNAVNKLGELEVTGVAATKAENHAKLEVDDAKGTHVIAKSGGQVLLDAYVGTYQSGNSMLRLNGQNDVATVKGSIRYLFTKQPRDWRDRSITKIDVKDVQELAFDNKNGHFAFKRKGDDWEQVLQKKEKPIEPLDLSKIKGLASTAATLNASDFADPSVTDEKAGLGASAAVVTLHATGEGGDKTVVYRIGNQEGQNYYLRPDGGELIYLLSSWTAGRLMPNRDAFVKKEEPKKAGALGSPGNPIPVEPSGMQVMPPGFHPPPPQ
jgi:hypothetical protein